MGVYDGQYKIYPQKGIWFDSSNNIGAIYIKTGKVKANKTNTVSLTNFPNATITKV